jgi:hypothetical protein
MNHVERSSDDVDWIHLGQDREQWLTLVSTVMNSWVL